MAGSRGSSRSGSSLRTELTRGETAALVKASSGAASSSERSCRGSVRRGSSQASSRSLGSTTGIRSWIAASCSLAAVVMIVKVVIGCAASPSPPSRGVQRS